MEDTQNERLFIAVDLPRGIKTKITNLQEGLEGTNAKIVNPSDLHMTLCFIGEVEKRDIKRVLDIFKRIRFKKSELFLKGVSAFPNPYTPQIIFLKVYSDESVKILSDDLYYEFRVKPDYKDFKSHITLARFRKGKKGKIMNFVVDNKDTVIGDCLMDKISLYSSRLTKSGPVYEKLGEVRAINSL